MVRTSQVLGVLAASITVLAGLGAIPISQAGGTDPACSSNCSLLYNKRYYPLTQGTDDTFRGFARVDQVNDGSSTDDWFNVVNTLRQIDTISHYEYPNFFVEFGEKKADGGQTPEKVDWEPGVGSTTDDQISYSITSGGGGVSATTNWANQWDGAWHIADEGEWQRTENLYYFDGHQEWFNVQNDDRDYNWDRTTFGAAWNVQEDKVHGVYIRGAMKLFTGVSIFWAWEDSGWKWIGLQDEEEDCEQTDSICEASVIPSDPLEPDLLRLTDSDGEV